MEDVDHICNKNQQTKQTFMNIVYLSTLVSVYKPICLYESWSKQNSDISQINLTHYNMFCMSDMNIVDLLFMFTSNLMQLKCVQQIGNTCTFKYHIANLTKIYIISYIHVHGRMLNISLQWKD